MMNRKFWMVFVLAIPLALGVIGCSDDDTNSDTPIGPGDETAVTLDASDDYSYAYFDFSTGETVTVTDPQTDQGWDMAFKKYEPKLNGGDGGPGGVAAYDLGIIDYDALTAVPDSVTADSFKTDEYGYVVEGWYSYDPQSHTTPATLRPFVMRAHTGDFKEYIKFRILEAVPASQSAIGTLTIEYEMATGSSFTGANDTIFVTDNTDSKIYIDFSSGGTISVTDREASSDWDLLFDGYTVMINGGASGPAGGGVYPIYDEETDYNNITAVPMDIGGSYASDFFDCVLSNWWSYSGPPNHTLSPYGYVYLIQTADAVYKFEVLGYYDADSGEAGYITFQYEEIQ